MPLSPSPRPESARHQYVAEIAVLQKDGDAKTISWDGLCQSAVDAIHAVHRFAQREYKPHLKPDEYRIKSLCLCYKELNGKRQYDERVELPDGPNPYIGQRRARMTDNTADFPLRARGHQSKPKSDPGICCLAQHEPPVTILYGM